MPPIRFFLFLLLAFSARFLPAQSDSSLIFFYPPAVYSADEPTYSKDRLSATLVGVTALPKEMLKETQLKRIALFTTSAINMEALVKQLENFPALVSLAFIGCNLHQFPEELCALTNLRSLTIVYDEFKVVPESISKLKNLQYLDLGDGLYGGNGIRELPASLGQLTDLTQLHLFGNDLDEFPETFSKLPLTTLNLRYNRVRDVSHIMKMTSLVDLDLSYNPVESLAGLERLSELRVLDLHSCGLTDDQLPLDKLTKLEKLYIGENPGIYTESLFRRIALLPRLRLLDLHHAGMTELPQALGNCPALVSISLARCDSLNLDQAMPVLAQISTLRDLSFRQSGFSRIPENISLLQQLTDLDLAFNQLDAAEVKKVKRLLPNVKLFIL